MHYDVELRLLLEKYGLSLQEERTNMDSFILFKYREIPRDHKVAIWGAGEHTKYLLKTLRTFKENKISIIIDKNQELHGKSFGNYVIAPPHIIQEENIDTIIISSFQYRNEIKEEILRSFPNCSFIDIYDNPFVNYGWMNDYYYLYKGYVDLYISRKLYEISKKTDEKEFYLIQLIKKYFFIRDFYNGQKYLLEYINLGLPQKTMFEKFLFELKQLLNKLKITLSNKQEKDAVIIILDTMRARDLQKMPYLSKFSKKCINFNEAYSTSTYTIASCKGIFNSQLHIDDQLEDTKGLEVQESKFFNYFHKKGFELHQYSGMKLEENNLFHSEGLSGKKVDYNIEAPISTIFWNYICDIVSKPNKPTLSILEFWELHYPFISGFHSNKILTPSYIPKFTSKEDLKDKSIIDKALRQLNESLVYVDNQLSFFFELLTDNITIGLISDHGTCIEDNDIIGSTIPWYDENFHVICMLFNGTNNPTEINNIFSLKNFSQQFIYFFENSHTKPIKDSFVELQRGPILSKRIKNKPDFLKNINENLLNGFKAIKTKEEKFILYDNGVEEYYILPNEQLNLIKDEIYRKKIDKLRELVSDKFWYLQGRINE